MPQDRIEFVDSISATAGIRLSLSGRPFSVLFAGTALPPPSLRRVTVTTMLEDGGIIPAAAYDNRVLTLHVQIDADTPGNAATQLQRLNRELDRATNILRWQPEPTTPPVYFRTFRAPDYDYTVDHGLNIYDIVLQIIAEPFAYGEAEDSGNVVVRNNPQDPDNPKFFEVTGVKGDVETPLIVNVDAVMWYHQSVFACRRGGTPSQAPRVLEAESTTLGTNTALSAGGSAYSGTGTNNTAVTTFATLNTLTEPRLSVATFPAAASPDVRGTYRVFARVNASATGTTFQVRMYHGKRNIYNDSQAFTIFNTNRPIMVDCGTVQLPEGFDPNGIGPAGSRLSVAGGNFQFGIQRLAGTGNAIWDYILFVPADDKFCLVNWGTVETNKYVMDGYQRAIYGLDASGNVIDIGPAYFIGDPPVLSPGVTNRITYINDVSPSPGADDFNTWTATLTYRYYPRYLYVRPVSS